MPSTTTYQRGDLLLLAFPFSGSSQVKNRPAMVIAGTGDADVVVARVTTQLYETACDIEIVDWRAAGLAAPSVVRLHKIATLEKALVRRLIGRLQVADMRRATGVLRRLYGR